VGVGIKCNSNSSFSSWRQFITKENTYIPGPRYSYGSGISLFSMGLCVRPEDQRCFSTALCRFVSTQPLPCSLQVSSSSTEQDDSAPSHWWCMWWTTQDVVAIRSWWKRCVSEWWIEIYQNSDSWYLYMSHHSKWRYVQLDTCIISKNLKSIGPLLDSRTACTSLSKWSQSIHLELWKAEGSDGATNKKILQHTQPVEILIQQRTWCGVSVAGGCDESQHKPKYFRSNLCHVFRELFILGKWFFISVELLMNANAWPCVAKSSWNQRWSSWPTQP
jgi:hypothetical protein